MYDIKFPQFVNTQYIKQCANCPYMNLTADTDYDPDRRRHFMKCANLEACMRVAREVEYEREAKDGEEDEGECEEYKAN